MTKKFFIVLFIVCSNISKAQFLRGYGIFLSVNHSAHKYENKNEGQKNPNIDTPDNFPFNAYYPPSHISREYFNWGAGIFAELLNSYNFRWQTEFEFTHKGAKEKEIIEPFYGTRATDFSINKYTYFQWNNYLKYYNPIGFSSHWYIMPGIRLEYLFQKSVSAFKEYSSTMPTIFFSGNIGLGYEFPVFRKISAIIEYHWNPDILSHKKNNIAYRNRTFELRVCLIFRPHKKSIDDCNTPKYNGPNY